MSSRSSSPTPSSSSSAGGSDVDDAAASRLAALEALLSASLGYDEPAQPQQIQEDEPPRKKQKQKAAESDKDEVAPAPAAVEAGPTEVSFRLFSTQKAPQTVVIDEEDEVFEVKDPRIRDVADEPKAIVKQRHRDIQSIAVSGEELIAQSTTQPPSRFQHRVTTRTISAPPRSRALPPLAYLNAILQPKTKATTRAKPTSLHSKKRLLCPQAKRHPGPPPESVKLRVVSIGKKAVANQASGEKKAAGGGRKRLSSARRIAQRKKEAKEMVKKALAAVEPTA